ncbi:antibiotic biosynthesis monooxygenase [Kribbella sp. NPDC050241]|uniref:antibiotic biosynthesis monooxygenase n=1 Tax=Kribbella sp. NPDC050241 TaxID=3364115 RepID=UPI0037B0CC84
MSTTEQAVVRMHNYSVDPENVAEFLKARATVVDTIRAAHPGLVATRLVHLEDGTYSDTWQWTSMQAMAAAFPLAQSPEAVAAWALASTSSALNGEIVDER